VLICIILEKIFESRAVAALHRSHQDRFSTKLRVRAKSLSFFSFPRFPPLRLAPSLCGGDKGRSLSKIPPAKSNIWVRPDSLVFLSSHKNFC
jgi:hypothetical protein